ncbi:MAG: hypothetical protein IJS79_02780 [Oscillospiraceae bacterium]|nr:hypothetical protein [Oscillospiraceae bacterium]
MLGKLMKYDLRSMLRRFGGLWIAIAALSVINGFSIRGAFEQATARSGWAAFFLSVLPPMLLFGLYVATGVLTLIFICERFYKGLLGDEGYLMFTLPASVSAHIGSKTLSALILELLSFLVAVISGMLLLVISAPEELANSWQTLREGLAQVSLPASLPWLIVECVVLSLIGIVAETLKIYAAIALGHLAKKHRVLWAIVSYIGLNIVLSFLLGLSVERAAAWNLFSGLANPNFGVEFVEGKWAFEGVGLVAGVTGGAIVGELLLCAALFFLTRWILKNKLNLE